MSPNRKNRIRTSLRLPSVVILLLLVVIVPTAVVFFLSAANGLSEGERRFLSEAVAQTVRLRNEAEQWAHRIKGDYDRHSREYELAYNKYIPAKAATDAWADRFVVDLITHTDISSSSQYQAALRDAAAKGEDFINYASGLYAGSLREKTIVDLLGPLTDVGIKISKEFRTASKNVIEEVKKELQALKWKPFDQT
jgi:hypothetical protein